ncbi:hypothetical protein GOFOIKOB_3664 [Methylobacterium tardum]|nr:hypothetical protein GOFOIKOB_3664 [Methylobacterium tardum]
MIAPGLFADVKRSLTVRMLAAVIGACGRKQGFPG